MKQSKLTLTTLLVAASLSLGLAHANEAMPKGKTDYQPSLSQGLDRERAAYRAEVLEERRHEQHNKHMGAGLDRTRAQMRADKLEQRRQQYN